MTLPHEQPSADPLTPEQQFEHDIAIVLQTALEHHHTGEFAKAETLYQAILEAKPDHVDANYNLGVLRVQTARPAEALPHFEIVLGLAPQNGQFWVAYINALIDAGQVPAAWLALEMGQQQGLKGPAVDGLIVRMASPATVIPTFAVPVDLGTPQAADTPASVAQTDTAEDAAPRAADVRRPSPQDENRLVSLFNKGRVPESIKLARTLTERFPGHGPSWRLLGIALHRNGQYDDAVAPLQKSVELLPEEIETRTVLADTLRLKGLYAQAEKESRALLDLNPNHAEGHRILGMALAAQGRFADGLAASRRSIELAPDAAVMHSTLGVLLLEQGFVSDAEECFRRALEAEPKDALAHNSLLFCLTHRPGIDPDALFTEHRKFAERHETPVRPFWRRHTNNRTPSRQLKIGLVSGDLFRHAVASYLMPIMERLAADPGLSLHVYNNHIAEDDNTQTLRGYADTWHPVTGMPDELLAAKIREDRIDILIDLSGHTGRNRLLTFVRKPAPIQLTWLGYPATTGLTAMDYYIADRFALPFGPIERQFTEKIVQLPSGATFQPEKNAPPVNILPAMHNGYVTFGSFNRLNKLRPDVISLWSELLRAMPTSRMLLGSIPNDGDEKILVDWFAREGISRDRLTFRRRSTIPVYLQQHHQVDICLDTFPYNGSTTTAQALWMGVPTLTIEGHTLASRGGITWMSHVRLEAFVARDNQDFVAKGLSLAADIPALASLRTGLRERCMRGAAFQPDLVAASLSRALRTMWERWCAGESPAAFEVQSERAADAALETLELHGTGGNQ